MKQDPGLPGYWELLWMLFMQPVSLHHRLKDYGIEKPGNPAWRLWLQGGVERAYGLRMLIVQMTMTLLLSALLIFGLQAFGSDLDLLKWAVAVAGGIAGTLILGITGGLLFGIALGIAGAGAGNLELDIAGGVVFGVALNVVFGMTWGVVVNKYFGVILCLVFNIALSFIWTFIKGAKVTSGLAVTSYWDGSLEWDINFGWTSIIFFLHIPFYSLELILQPLLYLSQRFSGWQTLRWSPLLHHDLIYFPLLSLTDHIVLAAKAKPKLARRALEVCNIAPGLRQIGHTALVYLQAQEMETFARTGRFDMATQLQGIWLSCLKAEDLASLDDLEGYLAHYLGFPANRQRGLPFAYSYIRITFNMLANLEHAIGITEKISHALDTFLLAGFADVARYLQAAQHASLAYHRLNHLDNGGKALQALESRLLTGHSDLARALRPVLPAWRSALEQLRAEAEQQAVQQVPNPFRSGNPLEPETGWEVFRGREHLIQRVEALLADANNAASLALLGPRRCGKTSLLKMLPVFLPDAVVVLFDLQDNPVDSLVGLFEAMDSQARSQARRDRQLELPALDRQRLQDAPFEAAKAWLDALEAALDGRRLLFCIDEFERLEDLFPGPRQDLLKFMGLLRATIQHKRRVRLLVSGAAPFEEWGELWSDHFINTREIPIGHLDKEATLGLLTKPFPAFPDTAIPLPVAEAVYARCHGQPYLAQLYGSLLVSRLNGLVSPHPGHLPKGEGEKQCGPHPAGGIQCGATLEDVEAVEPQVLEQGAYYFRHFYRTAPAAARAALDGLALGQTPALDPPTRRWLERRLLIDAQGRLNIPVLGRWIKEEIS